MRFSAVGTHAPARGIPGSSGIPDANAIIAYAPTILIANTGTVNVTWELCHEHSHTNLGTLRVLSFFPHHAVDELLSKICSWQLLLPSIQYRNCSWYTCRWQEGRHIDWPECRNIHQKPLHLFACIFGVFWFQIPRGWVCRQITQTSDLLKHENVPGDIAMLHQTHAD